MFQTWSRKIQNDKKRVIKKVEMVKNSKTLKKNQNGYILKATDLQGSLK